jgi:hypothetical protein
MTRESSPAPPTLADGKPRCKADELHKAARRHNTAAALGKFAMSPAFEHELAKLTLTSSEIHKLCYERKMRKRAGRAPIALGTLKTRLLHIQHGGAVRVESTLPMLVA